MKLKTLAIIATVTFMSSCQTSYQKQNKTNDGKPCPMGAQADKYGMECKTIVKEEIPMNQTKLQKFNGILGKVNKGISESETLNAPSSQDSKKDCISCTDPRLRRMSGY